MLMSGLERHVCSAGALRCNFIWFNEIWTKQPKRLFGSHCQSYTSKKLVIITVFCGGVGVCVCVFFNVLLFI